MILSIDTSQDDYAFGVYWPGKIQRTFFKRRQVDQDALYLLTLFLKEVKISPKELKAVVVFRGPGSYTGLRSGISIANSIGYLLNIPVIGLFGKKYQRNPQKMAQRAYLCLVKGSVRSGKIVKPFYSEPKD